MKCLNDCFFLHYLKVCKTSMCPGRQIWHCSMHGKVMLLLEFASLFIQFLILYLISLINWRMHISIDFLWIKSELFSACCSEGRTGVPFVDANMRELALTGFMSNRGRQNVASFLTKDLGLDWRLGAEWFEYLLVGNIYYVWWSGLMLSAFCCRLMRYCLSLVSGGPWRLQQLWKLALQCWNRKWPTRKQEV